MPTMPAVVIRNLPAATHRALKLRAAQHGRSTEAEIRSILETAVHPPLRTRLGSQLAAIGQQVGGFELKIERSPAPTKTIDLD
jgi:plasmid stability protein